MAPVAWTSILRVGWTGGLVRTRSWGQGELSYKNLGQVTVGDVGQLCAVVLGDDELRVGRP